MKPTDRERGRIKLIIDRCHAHEVPDAADEIERLAAERDTLAAQVVQMREALAALRPYKERTYRKGGIENWTEYSVGEELCKILDQCDAALSLDTSAAEQILREREAKVLEEAVRIASRFSVKPDRSLHPDIPWEKMHQSVQVAAHSTAQSIAIEIQDLAAERRK